MDLGPIHKELVSIILPVYNGERYLRESILSCLSQTHEFLEIIIINDCSTDGSLAIAQECASIDERIRIISNKTNLRLPASLNVGHREAKGDYITWTSDDNRFRESAIQTMIANSKEHQADLVYSHCNVIDEKGNVSGFLNAKEPSHLLFENVVGACFLYKKEILSQIGNYSTDLFLVEDYDFWIRIAEGGKLKAIPEILYDYRIHDSSLTAEIENDSIKNDAFLKRKRTIFDKYKREAYDDRDALVVNFLLQDLDKISIGQEIFKSQYFLKDIRNYVQNFKAMDSEVVIQRTIAWLTDLVLREKDFQSFSKLLYLYKNYAGFFTFIPIRRQIALFKKCL